MVYYLSFPYEHFMLRSLLYCSVIPIFLLSYHLMGPKLLWLSRWRFILTFNTHRYAICYEAMIWNGSMIRIFGASLQKSLHYIMRGASESAGFGSDLAESGEWVMAPDRLSFHSSFTVRYFLRSITQPSLPTTTQATTITYSRHLIIYSTLRM